MNDSLPEVLLSDIARRCTIVGAGLSAALCLAANEFIVRNCVCCRAADVATMVLWALNDQRCNLKEQFPSCTAFCTMSVLSSICVAGTALA